MQFFPSLCPFYIPTSRKRYPFRVEPRCASVHHKEYPLFPPPSPPPAEHDPVTMYKISHAGPQNSANGLPESKWLLPVKLGIPLFWMMSHCITDFGLLDQVMQNASWCFSTEFQHIFSNPVNIIQVNWNTHTLQPGCGWSYWQIQ